MFANRESSHEPATRSCYIHGGFQMSSNASEERWVQALFEFGRTHGRPVLLAIDDDSAVFVDDHHATLNEAFQLTKDPAGLHRRLVSKRQLWELCTELGLPAPKSSFPTSEREAAAMADAYRYPVVLKRSDHTLPANDQHAPSVLIAHNQDELLHGYRRMESPNGPNVIVQEYLPGGPETVWMFDGYFDRDSECLCAFTGQKLRQRGPRTGPTTLGVCSWNTSVAELAQRLMKGIGYHGIVDMGFRHDERDGEFKLLDVNPRMGSSFRLFVGEDGLDVVRAAYLDLTGQSVRPSRARDGRKWIVEPYDLVAAVQMALEGSLAPSEWARSFSSVNEAAWWARDDPLPFYAMCASAGLQGFRYSARRRRRRWSAKRASRSARPNVFT